MTTAAWAISNSSAMVEILAMEAEVLHVEAGRQLFEVAEAIVVVAAEGVTGKIVVGAVDSEVDVVDFEDEADTRLVASL